MVKNYGILQAIFNLDNDINLNRAFSEPWSIHNPILKSVDSSKDQLNANFLIYSFYYAESLEHIPQINIKNTNQYNGLDTVNNTKLKYIQIKSINKLSTDAKFQDTKLLEKIDLDKESDYKQGDYLNNESLKMLPKGSFSQSTDLTNFLTNAIKLENTDLDLSSATNLTKLDVYGTSTKRIDGLKSLIVSNEAPFDGNSPQINVSYTGLNRTALVNLFNTLPYNVGYVTVGSPTISDGIVSNFSTNNYLYVNYDYAVENSFEIVCTYTMPNTLDTNTLTPLFIGNCATNGLDIYWDGTYAYPHAYLNSISGSAFGVFSYSFRLQPGETYTSKLTKSGDTYTLDVYQNGELKVSTSNSNHPGGLSGGASPNIGATSSEYFSGSIDLNNTYIKINGIPLFVGKASMTKNCSIIGCSGTSSLTNDDKAIATSKGWTLQDS